MIHQLLCVDAFLAQYGDDPYEPYDPAWFVSVPGKDRAFPFAYPDRWRGRLKRRMQEQAERFGGRYRGSYEYGLVNFGAFEGTWRKGGTFRSLSGLGIDDERAVWGKAELDFEVYGLTGRREYLFWSLYVFVEGLAAAEMYERMLAFLAGDERAVSTRSEVRATTARWTGEGFQMRRGMNVSPGRSA